MCVCDIAEICCNLPFLISFLILIYGYTTKSIHFIVIKTTSGPRPINNPVFHKSLTFLHLDIVLFAIIASRFHMLKKKAV